MGMIFPELIAVDIKAEDANDAIKQVGKLFFDHDFVKETYIAAVTAREIVYPTGLQLQDIAIAMPHTDPEHVNKPGVCVAQLSEPVIFSHMGDPDTKVNAEIIFMMSILSPDEQIETLQKVLHVFQNPEIVAEFKNAENKDELYEVAVRHID